MRKHIEHWIDLDTHKHFGTAWLTGGPVGQWYSVNDFAMTRLVRDYVRFTGDAGVPGRVEWVRSRSSEHLHDWATAWRGLRGEHALADYGGIDNLLECVSTYTHEVASFNAANVWSLRVAAEVADALGDADRAELLRKEADEQAGHVNELYVEGEGFWHARQPDGSTVPVRHCYDFNIVGTTIADDLSTRPSGPRWWRSSSASCRRRSGCARSRRRTPMRPSASGPTTSGTAPTRPGRPTPAARSFALGRGDVALDWLPGLARTANQGPVRQAHFVEEAEPLMAGGARKSPPQFPYLIDWACSSSGSWVSLILEGVFGVEVALDGTVTANPQVAALDPDARLTGLRVGPTTYDVTADGVTPGDLSSRGVTDRSAG